MTYSAITLNSSQADYVADRPVIIGTNSVRAEFEDGTYTHRWNQTGSFATGDSSDALADAIYAGDNGSNVITRPNSSQTTWYFLMSFDPVQTFDSLAILNHNLGSVSATVALEIANDFAFTTNLIQLYTTSPSDDTRIVTVDLRHTGSTPLQYQSVEFARLKITAGGAIKPQFGEVILGIRRQLSRDPADPYDPRNLRTESALMRSNSGVPTRYVWGRGQRHIAATLPQVDSTYYQLIGDMYRDDCDYGSQPLLWIDKPYTEAEKAAWMHWQQPDLVGPYDGPEHRVFSLSLLEIGPHYQALET